MSNKREGRVLLPCEKYRTPRKNYSSQDSLGNTLPMNKKNVFIIILESFSAEHIGALTHQPGNKKSDFAPFLDSLVEHSIVYEGFANGKRSIEG